MSFRRSNPAPITPSPSSVSGRTHHWKNRRHRAAKRLDRGTDPRLRRRISAMTAPGPVPACPRSRPEMRSRTLTRAPCIAASAETVHALERKRFLGLVGRSSGRGGPSTTLTRVAREPIRRSASCGEGAKHRKLCHSAERPASVKSPVTRIASSGLHVDLLQSRQGLPEPPVPSRAGLPLSIRSRTARLRRGCRQMRHARHDRPPCGRVSKEGRSRAAPLSVGYAPYERRPAK